MNSDRSVLIGIGKRTEFSHAECVRDHQLLECHVPFEINNVIRIEAGYTHVLNEILVADMIEQGVYELFTCLPENTFKLMMIP